MVRDRSIVLVADVDGRHIPVVLEQGLAQVFDPPGGDTPQVRIHHHDGLGVQFDGQPGPLNAISDVAGVRVGHTTLVRGEGGLRPGASYRTRTEVKVRLQARRLQGVILRGSGEVRADRIVVDVFEATLQGSGDIVVEWLNLDYWTIPVYEADADTPRCEVRKFLSA